MSDQEGDWDFYLRILSNSARDSTDPASDPSILQSVKKLHGFCKMEKSDDLVARIYPQFNKVFHRSVASLSQSESGASKGLLLLVHYSP
jgi:AP-5 complex subunit zeta-1